MKKLLMLFALGGLLSCAWIFAMDEDFKGIAPDDDETSYQNENSYPNNGEEDFKIGGEESDQLEEEKADCSDCTKDCEKIGYIDDELGQ